MTHCLRQSFRIDTVDWTTTTTTTETCRPLSVSTESQRCGGSSQRTFVDVSPENRSTSDCSSTTDSVSLWLVQYVNGLHCVQAARITFALVATQTCLSYFNRMFTFTKKLSCLFLGPSGTQLSFSYPTPVKKLLLDSCISCVYSTSIIGDYYLIDKAS